MRYPETELVGSDAFGVAFDSDGNVIVVGYDTETPTPWHLFVGKYDPAGLELWTAYWDGTTGEGAQALAVATDDAGDIVVVGRQRVVNRHRFVVRKYGPDGTARWTTEIESEPDSDAIGRAVAIGPNRRIWVAGGVDVGVDALDIYVARLAP
ncbi:MAG: hypothetical protein KDK70_04435 [Myxococcales bacterium]|nr:hypothetical protein [Myxococcales bacterium]